MEWSALRSSLEGIAERKRSIVDSECKRGRYIQRRKRDESDSSDSDCAMILRPFKQLRLFGKFDGLCIGSDLWGLVISFCWTDYPCIASVCKLFSSRYIADCIVLWAQLVPRYPESLENGLKIDFSIRYCCELYKKRNFGYAVHLGLVGIVKALNPGEQELVEIMFLAAEEGQIDVLKYVIEEMHAPVNLFGTEFAEDYVITDQRVVQYIEKMLGCESNCPFSDIFPDEIMNSLMIESDDEQYNS